MLVTNYAKRVIGHLGGHRHIDLAAGALDYRRDVRETLDPPEGFVDLSEALRAGVYLLVADGEVVFVGEATSSMLAAISAKLGPQPRFLPKIRFDQILIRPCHPDKMASLRAELIATYTPRYNQQRSCAVDQIQRRAL